MKTKIKNNDKPKQDYFDTLREALEKFKRRIADYLSRCINKLSPRARKVVLISSGLLIAALCFKLVFAPGEFNVTFGAIRRTITAPSLPDSTKTGPDSLINSNN